MGNTLSQTNGESDTLTMDEVIEVIQKRRKYKASGIDGLPGELFKT